MTQFNSKFEDMNLQKELLKGIINVAFSKPTTIQQQTIVPITTGSNVIIQFQSGTGKTATFWIGVLAQIVTNNHHVQCLILSPTRELAQEKETVLKGLSRDMNVHGRDCIGGKSERDVATIEHGWQIISGTPGRIFILITRKVITTKTIKCFVLDEADQLLEREFQQQILDINKFLPTKHQTLIVSATLTDDVIKISSTITDNAIEIWLKRDEITLEEIHQYFVELEESQKFDGLCEL